MLTKRVVKRFFDGEIFPQGEVEAEEAPIGKAKTAREEPCLLTPRQEADIVAWFEDNPCRYNICGSHLMNLINYCIKSSLALLV